MVRAALSHGGDRRSPWRWVESWTRCKALTCQPKCAAPHGVAPGEASIYPSYNKPGECDHAGKGAGALCLSSLNVTKFLVTRICELMFNQVKR